MTNLTSAVHFARTRANWSNDLLLNTNYETFNYIFHVKEYIYVFVIDLRYVPLSIERTKSRYWKSIPPVNGDHQRWNFFEELTRF